MLNLQASFERKPVKFDRHPVKIVAVEILPREEFLRFASHTLEDYDFIAAHKGELGVDKNCVTHALLVLDEESPDGVLVDSQGYNYARYASWAPGIKNYFNAQMLELADAMIQAGTQHTESGSWCFSFEELEKEYGVQVTAENGIGKALLGILQNEDPIAAIEMNSTGFDMNFYLDFCPNCTEALDDGLKARDLFSLGFGANIYLVHAEQDIGFVPVGGMKLDEMPDTLREQFADVLNARVEAIRPGAYGTHIVLSEIAPQRLSDFDEALHERLRQAPKMNL